MTSAGFRILPAPPQADEALIARLRALPAANISDCMHRLTGTSALRPYYDGPTMAGTAVTVRARPGDNLLLHKMLDLARPGDIVVVDGGGDLNNSLFGEIMQMYAVSRGIGGIVIDGAIRDAAYLRASSFPVFARGVAHRGPYKDGPGEINVPVSIAGMTVLPGDIVVGDEDGVLAISPDDAELIATAAEAKADQESETKRAILAGTLDRSQIDEALKSKGFRPAG